MWNTSSYEQKSAILNLDHPLTEESELHLDVNVTRGDAAFRYAPSIGSFTFTPNPGLLGRHQRSSRLGLSRRTTTTWFVVAHRFVRHGNRDWLTDTEEYDVSVGLEGRITEGPRLRCAHQRLSGWTVSWTATPSCTPAG